MSTWGTLAPYLKGGAILLIGFGIVAVGVSVFYFRRARSATYYTLREQARGKGQRWSLSAVVTIILGIVLLILRANTLPSDVTTLPPQPSLALTPLLTIHPTLSTMVPVPTSPATEPVTEPATAPASPNPTATQPFIPTPTPIYPLPETGLSPLPGQNPPNLGAQIIFSTFALGEENGQPVDPADTFSPGQHRVYYFFEHREMSWKIPWTYAWYRDGEYLAGDTRLWVLTRNGTNFLYFMPPGGYTAGVYEVRIWIGGGFQDQSQFVIR